MGNTKITKVFVLMLENRSFDHMLGFSDITGIDAETGNQTSINNLSGKESNSYLSNTYTVLQPADFIMPVDPAHEFLDVVEQLCGSEAIYPFGGSYPQIDNSGFVLNYVTSNSPYEGKAPDNFGEILKCYSPSQLPILNTLAKTFAICDNWYTSMPGPTWPNRFFLHAASSSGLDHSPTTEQILDWETVDGFGFKNKSIFDAIGATSNLFGWKIYRGASNPLSGSIPIVSALKGISLLDTSYFDDFANDIRSNSYPWNYTFIEPNYGDVTDNSYSGGTSQHPMDNVVNGELLIKTVYESIRNSPHWNESLLIVVWDEHGGFYDHVIPGSATAPGDSVTGSAYNQYGFTFDQYGPRVPALVISPYIPNNTIDHRLYDHSSVLATIENLFGISSLTERDANANNLTSLLSLDVPRTDAPTSLPEPAASPSAVKMAAASNLDSLEKGNLPGFLAIVLKTELEISPAIEHPAIIARFRSLKTRGDAKNYLNEVMPKVHMATLLRKKSRTL